MTHPKAMKASPRSPPTMWTPPSGMERPLKKVRMSTELADHDKFCSRMMTLMLRPVRPLGPLGRLQHTGERRCRA